MQIDLAAYRPFNYTKAIHQYSHDAFYRPTQDLVELAKKIGRIALAILTLLPAVLLDLVITPVAWVYGKYCINQQPTLSLHAPSSAVESLLALNDITETQAARILAPPPVRSHLGPDGNTKFMTGAIKHAFQLNTLFNTMNPASVTIIRQMIENQGEPNEGDPPFDVFQWSAGSLLAHYLICTLNHRLFCGIYPAMHPNILLQGNTVDAAQKRGEAQAHKNNIAQLTDQFLALPTQKEKALALLEVVIPQVQRPLTSQARKFVNALNARAVAMTRDRIFINEIYRPAVENIENL